MRTNYIGHDRVYQAKRERGETGWDSTAQVKKNLENLWSLLKPADLPAQPAGLELGCGAGDISLHLAERGWRMNGVDISPVAVDWAREKARSLNLDVTFHVADVCSDLTLSIDSVDAVLDGHCLHCIIGTDRAAFFRNARRYLKPNGYLLIDSMCGEPHSDDARQCFCPQTRCLIRNGIAARYLGTPESILAEISEAGFVLVKSEVQPASGPDDQDSLLAIATLALPE